MSAFIVGLSRLRANRSGSVTILFGIGCVCFFMVVGLSVDTARYYNLASKIQDSLDASTLAGAKYLDDGTMTDEQIAALTRSNFAAALKQLGVKAREAPTLSVVVDRNDSSVQSTSNLAVRSLFGPIVMLPQYVEITRTSKVVYDMKQVELALVLDITGSMNSKNKISDMKVAATDIIDELLGSAVNENSVRVAIAPYSAAVNAGTLADNVSAGSGIDSCVIERNGSNASTDAAPYGADKVGRVSVLPYGNYSCPPSPVVPLTGKSGLQILKDRVNSYVALGSTAGHIGTAWGWYLLSPSWSSVLPANSTPGAYSNKKLNKTALIMTDGEFNTSYISGSSSDRTTQLEESYNRFQSICAGMKADGITIYTVGFDLNDSRAISELKQCASSEANFYDAKTGADLKAAFRSVAANLNNLRIAS